MLFLKAFWMIDPRPLSVVEGISRSTPVLAPTFRRF
jgi:hypothetical protein